MCTNAHTALKHIPGLFVGAGSGVDTAAVHTIVYRSSQHLYTSGVKARPCHVVTGEAG